MDNCAQKLAPDEQTRTGTPEAKSGVRTRTDSTRQTYGNMRTMANPVEREMMLIQSALERQAMLEAKVNAVCGSVKQTAKKAVDPYVLKDVFTHLT